MSTSIIPHTSALVLGEVLNAASNMVKEIAHYKRAVAELELQRLQMHEQAQIAHHQIEAQFKQAIHRMDHLSSVFKQTLQQNELLIVRHSQREKDVQQQCLMIVQLIAQTNDLESKKQLQSMWQELIKQMNFNRKESVRLQAQLMDANQQFGLSISHRDLSFKDVN